MNEVRKARVDDIVIWPNGSWCFYGELHEYPQRSPDYRIVPEGSPEWESIVGEF